MSASGDEVDDGVVAAAAAEGAGLNGVAGMHLADGVVVEAVDGDMVSGKPSGLADQYHLTKEISTDLKLEVSDPALIFSQVWRDLEAKYGVDQLMCVAC